MARLDEAQVYQWFDIFKNNNELVEIRLIGSNKTASGYFTDAKTLIEAIKPYTDAYNVYFTINKVNPACYGREQRDCIIQRPKNTTTDAEIIARDWVLLDLDAKRLTGTNATKEEAMKAHEKGKQIVQFLIDNGFYEPVVVFSSSGIHIYIRCAMLPTKENDAIVKRFTQAMSMLFSDENVEVDEKVFNLGRISRLMGSYSCKGASNSKERPQRRCRFLSVPSEIKVNAIEYFEKIAKLYPEEVKPTRENNYSVEGFDLDAFILKHNIPVTHSVEVADGTRYYLRHCLFNENHKGKDAILFKHKNGAIAYFCYHNSCSDNDWRKVRLMYEPDAYDRKNNTPTHRSFTPLKTQKGPIELQEHNEQKGEVWQTMMDIEDEDRTAIVSIPSGIAQYDKECCGYDKPSLSVWSGNNGSAKSTLLNQIALNAVNKGFKVAIYSGELRGKRLKRWLLFQAAGKTFNVKSQFNQYDYYTPNNVKDKIASWLGDNLYNYNTKYSHNIEQVCLEVEKIVKDKQVDMLILDNLSALDIDELDGGINEQQKGAIKLLLRLTERLGIATHLVVHPKKSEGYLRKNDVSGAKTLTDLADNVFFVHRWNQDTQRAAKEFLDAKLWDELNYSGTTNIVEVIKQREFGEAEGHIYKLYYEPESRRLKNDVAEHIIYGWQDQSSQASLISPNSDFTPNTEADPLPWENNSNYYEDDETPF